MENWDGVADFDSLFNLAPENAVDNTTTTNQGAILSANNTVVVQNFTATPSTVAIPAAYGLVTQPYAVPDAVSSVNPDTVTTYADADDKDYLCGICGETYRGETPYRQHMRRHEVGNTATTTATTIANATTNGLGTNALLQMAAQEAGIFPQASDGGTIEIAQGSNSFQVAVGTNVETGAVPYDVLSYEEPGDDQVHVHLYANQGEEEEEEEEVEQQVPEVMTPNLGGQVIGQLSISTMTQKPGRKKGAVKGKQGVSGAYLSNMDQAIRSEGGKHYCRVCGKCFARVDALKDHITTHTGVKPFNCHRCGAGFRRRAQLASHVLTCTCETSGGSQTEEEEGSQVTAEGSEVKVYRCVTTQCSEKFTQASALAEHMKVCIAQACRQSADSYKEYFALAEAACVKVGAQFQCSHCGKVFDRRDVHRDHVIQHTGVFPFNCDQCKRGFTRKSALAGHKCKGPRASPDTKHDKTAAKPAKKRGPKSKPKPVAEETVATGDEPAEEGLVVSDEQYRKTALIEGVDHELCEPEIERFERYKELGDTGLDCKTNLHYCKLCSFTDFDVTKARLHVTFHTHYYPYQCLGCKRDFNGAAGYIQHVNKCGHYKAERLNIRAGEKETKKLMADVISAIPAGACARFVTSVREGVSAVAGKLRCKLCAEESAEKRVILEHVTTHTNIFPFHCDACQAGFFTRVLLVEHESTCVEEEVLPNSITRWKTGRPEMQSGGGAWFATCPCKLQFHTKEELRDHYATCASHQRKLQKDAIADSVKQMSFNIVRDMIQTTPTPTTNFDGLSCANCSAAFGSIDSLRDHLATCSVNLTDPDSAANALTCANCDAQCETLAELKKHLVFCTVTSAPKTPATLIPTTTTSSVPLVVKNGTKPAAANQRVSQDVDSILRPLRGLDVLEVLKALQGLADELHLAEDEVYRVSPVYLASVQALVDALSPSDYECKICTSRYATSTVMNDHVTTHTNIYPFNCPWCRFGFNRKTALRQHVKKCEWIPDSLDPDDNLYSPSKDNKKAEPQARKATPQAAKQPKKKAAAGEAMTSPSNPMASPSGNHSFSEDDIGGACEAFLDMVQENQYRKPGIYGCKLCNKEWPRGDQLKDHLTLTHTKIYPYYCPNCKGPFLRKYKLRAHLPSCSGQPLTGTAGKTTPKSNKKAKRKSVADDVIIPPENVVTFADVHATFADVHATENNVTIAHDDAPAPLDDVVEHDDDDVVEVIAAATPNDGQKTENAPGAAMSDNTNLFDISEKYLESIKEWTGCRGTKMFCKFCNGYFPLVTELNEHITTHTGVFPFNCSQCNRGFNRTGELAGHINLCKTEEVISSKVSPKVSKGGVTIVREYEEKQETQQEGDLSMEVTCESFDVFPAYAGPVDDDVESAFNDVTVVHPSTSAKPSGRGRGKVKGRGGGRAGPKSKTAQKSAPPSGDDVVMFTDSEGDDVDGGGYYPSGDEDSNAAAGASTTQLFENIFDKVISKPAASDTKSPKRLETSAGYGATLNDYVKKYGNKLICKGCNKKFKNYRDIAEHVPSHTGIYPYTCGYCARGFTREKLLTEHLVKCTGEEEAAPPGGGRQRKLSPGSKVLLKDCHARGDAQISLAPVDRFSPGGARRKRGVESPPQPASASKRGRLADNPSTKSPAASSLLVPPTDGALGYSAAFIESAKNAYRFENGKYVCVTCGKEYSKEALVLGHVHTHTDILPYDCPLCPLSFSVKSKAEGHIKYCKSRADRAAKAGASPARAPPVFKSPTAAAKLTSPAPPAAPPAVVEIDEASITVSDAYLKSIDDGINFQDGELCCRYCEEPFDSLKLLREHIPTHTGITPYSCPACQIKFLNKEPLLRHMRKCVAASSPGVATTPTSRGVTSQPTAADYSEPEVEDSVDEVVYDAIELVQEPVDETQIVVSEKYLDSMKVNIKHFRGQNHCAICNMKFKQIRDLREHITSHTGILPFNCPHCETGFNRKSKIAEHIPQCRAKQQAAKVAPKPKAGPKSSKAQAGPKSSKAKAGPKSSKAPVISEPLAPRATRRSLVSAPEVDMTSSRASRRASATPETELQDTPRASRRAAAATPIEKNDTPRAAKRAAATFIADLESPRTSRRSSLPAPATSTTRQVATPAAAKPGPASSKSKSKAKAPSLETKNEAAGYDYSTTVSEEFMQAFWKQVKIKDGVYVCKCGRRASLANMRDHVMMHITLKPYNCFRCPMSFRRLPQIQKHLLTCGGEEGDNSQSDAELLPPAKKQKAAPKSEVISPKKSSRVSESPQKKAAATKECEDSPSGQIALSKDYLASIKKNTMSKGGKLSCKICRKSFRHQGSLNDHVISHTGIKPFSCPKCNAGYMTKGKLVTHIKSCAIKSVLRFSAKAKTPVKSKPGPASSKKAKAAPVSSKKPKPGPASSKKSKPGPASSKKSKPGPASSKKSKPGPASSKKSKPGPASSKKSMKSPLHKVQKSKVQKPAPKSKKLKLTKRSKELLKMCDQKLMKVKVEMDKAYEEAHEDGLGREATEEERVAITKRVVVLKLTRIPEKDLPKYDDDKKADTATDLDTTLPDVGSGADDRGSQTEDSAFSDSSSRPDGDAADGKRRRRKKRGTGEVKDLRKMLTLLSVSDQAKVEEEEEAGGGLYSDGPCLDDPTFKPDVDGEAENKVAETETKEDDKKEEAEPLAEGDEIKTAVESTGVNEAEKMEVSDDKDQESEATTENQTVENETEAPKEKNAEADPEHSKMDAEDKAQLEKAEDSGDVTESKMSEQGDDDFIVPESPSRDAEVTSPIPLPDNAVESESENDDHGETTTAVTEPELTEDDDQEENVKEGDEEERGVVKGGDEEPEDNKPEAPAAADEEEKEDVSPEPKSTGEDEDEINDGEVKRGTPVFCEEDRSPGTPAARSSASQGSSPVSHEKMDSCPASPSEGPSPAPESRSPSPAGQKKTSRSPSPTGQEKTSRSPSPTGQEKTSRSPSPTGQEKTSRSPSPTGQEKTSRSPSPTGEEKTSRSPSPTGEEKSSRSPSPTGQEKSSRSPSPTGEERASRSPSPTGEEPSPNSPSPTGEKSAFPAPGEELSPAPAEPTDDAERCMDGVTEAETPTYTTEQNTGTTTEQDTSTTAEQNADSDNEVPGGFFNSLVPYGTEDESSAAEDEEEPKEATPSGGDMWEDALAPVRHRKRTLSECNEGSEVEGQGSEVAANREIV